MSSKARLREQVPWLCSGQTPAETHCAGVQAGRQGEVLLHISPRGSLSPQVSRSKLSASEHKHETIVSTGNSTARPTSSRGPAAES